MTDDELTNELKSRNALVVHLSHFAKMREGGVFPKDMYDAIVHRNDWPLSCCVVWPGHSMELPGDVGVIFKPSSHNVISVSSSDSGSSVTDDGSDASSGVPLTMESLHESFDVSHSYNEWRIKGADVTGIFVANRNNIKAKKIFTLHAGDEAITDIAATEITIAEVTDAFPELPIYTILDMEVVLL